MLYVRWITFLWGARRTLCNMQNLWRIPDLVFVFPWILSLVCLVVFREILKHLDIVEKEKKKKQISNDLMKFLSLLILLTVQNC